MQRQTCFVGVIGLAQLALEMTAWKAGLKGGGVEIRQSLETMTSFDGLWHREWVSEEDP